MIANFTPFPVIITERLRLRQLRSTDVYDFYKLRTDPVVNKYIPNRKESTPEEIIDLIIKLNKGVDNNEYIFWIIEDLPSKTFAGSVCIWNLNAEKNCGELGYSLLTDFQNKGIMQEAIIPVLDYVFNVMKLERLEAFTHKNNLPSIYLLERNSFIRDLDLENNNMVNSDLVDMVTYFRTKMK